MTILEVKNHIFNRIGWRNEANRFNIIVSDDNQTSESGLLFQDQHVVVDLNYIYEVARVNNLDSDDFNDYLEELKNTTILQVLQELFNYSNNIDQTKVDDCINALDALVSLKMLLNVGERLLNSQRDNSTKLSVSIKYLSQLALDINGDGGKQNLPNVEGSITRYKLLLNQLRKKFCTMKTLKVVSNGSRIGLNSNRIDDTYFR